MKSSGLFILVISTVVAYCQSTKDPNAQSGRSVLVHLFEWKWKDIAAECERFLAPRGFAGVQVSPPSEHPNVNNPWRPWWQRYQPVSYKLVSRSGNEQEFIEMVRRCNAVGVRIYVDAVVNHMSAMSGNGVGGSWFDANQRRFPSVPYGPLDFNDAKCKTKSGNIETYNDAEQVRNCKLLNMPDLALDKEYVRGKVVEYLNRLIDIGVAGFRLDAAKHMWPGDLDVIVKRLKNLREDIYGQSKRPFIYQEVIDLGNEPIKGTEYTYIGRVTEFKYSLRLSEVINKRNNQKLRYLKNFGVGWGFMPDYDAIVFTDNHDNQRGHGAGGPVLTFFDSKRYKIGNSFMLAWPYGIPKLMSSYTFDRNNGDQGPPSHPSGETKDVVVYPDQTCGNGWICEHRWRQITNMVNFRNVAGSAPVANWWDNGENQIAFSRGNRAFIAINNGDKAMNVRIKTGLPPGTYCDINSGNKQGNSCTGRVVNVNADTTAQINIGNNEENPVIAIHIESKL